MLTAEGVARIMDSVTYNGFWIGLNDIGLTKSSWQWASGETSPVSDSSTGVWAKNQPNHVSGQDCVKMKIVKTGGWDDISCTKLLPYVCQKLI